MLVDMWKRYGWDPIPSDFLPSIGVVAEQGGKVIGAMFMYVNPGTVAFVDFAIVSPDISRGGRAVAMTECFGYLRSMAVTLRCGYLYTVTKIPAYKKFLEIMGMKACEEGMTSYVMPLKGQDVSALMD